MLRLPTRKRSVPLQLPCPKTDVLRRADELRRAEVRRAEALREDAERWREAFREAGFHVSPSQA